jgi:hypothetical protein
MIDFCWISVQGAEHLVLLGGLSALRRIRYLYYKFDSRPAYQAQSTDLAMRELLENNGFTYVEEYSDGSRLWKNTEADVHGYPLTAFSLDDISPLLLQTSQLPQASFTPIGCLEFDETEEVTSIVTPFSVQFGDQMFQYVAGKIMAEVTGLSYVPPHSFLTPYGHPITWSGDPLFQLSTTIATRLPIRENPKEFIGSHWIDWNEYKDASRVFMQGMFQRYECIKPWEQKIKSDWLQVKVSIPSSDPSALYIHCPRIDSSATFEEYEACIRQFPSAKQLVVCTDSPNEPWFDCFDEIGIPWTISNGTWDQDFLSLLSAKNLIISQDTYSWWAGFLGRATKIACPLSRGTPWYFGKSLIGPPKLKQDFPNLIVNDKPDRWIWIDINNPSDRQVAKEAK